MLEDSVKYPNPQYKSYSINQRNDFQKLKPSEQNSHYRIHRIKHNDVTNRGKFLLTVQYLVKRAELRSRALITLHHVIPPKRKKPFQGTHNSKW